MHGHSNVMPVVAAKHVELIRGTRREDLALDISAN